MKSFIDIKTKIENYIDDDGKKSEFLTIRPDFVSSGKDIMIKGGKIYAILDKDTNMWETNESRMIELIDNKLTEYRDKIATADDDGIYFTNKGKKRVKMLYLSYSSSNQLYLFRKWINSLPPNHNYHPLDCELTKIDEEVTPDMYRSKRLKYKIADGNIDNYNKLMDTLYSTDNRRKIEWTIGSIFTGDSKKIEKFLVLYGDPGSGKSTILDLMKDLFDGYYESFVAASLADKTSQFSTEFLRNNPIVAIQDDGSLAKIDSPLINEIVSHKEIVINEKNKSQYSMKMQTFLIMATNEKVDIHDTKLGITRRLLDVYPSGRRLPVLEYRNTVNNLKYELGAIAKHCIDVYEDFGREYYLNYVPEKMIQKTNYIRNFIMDNADFFINDEYGYFTRDTLYTMYKKYCEESNILYIQKRMDFGDSMIEYFNEFYTGPKWMNGATRRNFYIGFKKEKIDGTIDYILKNKYGEIPDWLKLDSNETSKFDMMFGTCLAQYTYENGKPIDKWEDVKTKLMDIDSSRLHYVKPPTNLIVIDFDLKDENGKKDVARNLEEAAKWPKTYAETSKSGGGIHLHYIYNGDINKLQAIYDTDIEIKVFKGNASLRRMVTKHNDEDIMVISSGLPIKEEKVLNTDSIKNDKHLRALIVKALRKEIPPHATKTSMDFIKKICDEAYESGLYFDVSDMRPDIHAFANNSSHNAMYCIGLMNKIHWMSKSAEEGLANGGDGGSVGSGNGEELETVKNENGIIKVERNGINWHGEKINNDDIIIFDCEVFENLFVICWKVKGVGRNVVVMENPSPDEVEELCRFKLVGFNNRNYDNHILYARIMGYNNYQLYELSQRIISDDGRNAKFGEAYKLSYTDIYDFLSSGNKMGLKKWEIKLRIHHQEVGIPWNEPVPEDKWKLVEEYCSNDVLATEAVWDANESDWLARCILADISGGCVNDTTNQCTTRLIVGNDKHPQDEFVYTNLADIFPGYEFNKYGIDKSRYNEGTKIVSGKSLYLGEDPGEGGYVYAEPGIHSNVGLLDVASMHPHSLIALNLFGKRYTRIFEELVEARVLIKHGDFDGAAKMLDGKLKPYLKDKKEAKKLSNALKTAINSVYGLTSAPFENKLKDPRNIDNIVAKYGALFMITLKKEVQKKGYTVVHIKTDSIKIENMDDYICKFCMDFAKKYGFTFEHEATYEKMCIVNDAVYIAKVMEEEGKKLEDKEFEVPKDIWESINWVDAYEKYAIENGYRYWTATGTQFQIPYVFKSLFAKEIPIIFYDYCETKQVTSALYLDMNEGYPDVRQLEAEHKKLMKKIKDSANEEMNDEIRAWCDRVDVLDKEIEKGHNYIFVGKIGSFVPVKEGCGGGYLMREQNGNYNSVTGTKKKDGSGMYRFLEAESLLNFSKKDRDKMIDKSYFNDLANEAINTIEKYGIFDDFANSLRSMKEPVHDFMNIPETDEEYVPFDLVS